jgi:O-antigen ligase
MYHKLKDYILPFAICFIIFIGFWSVESTFYILISAFIWFFISDLISGKKNLNRYRFSKTDLAIIFISIAEIICYLTSVYKPNSFGFTLKILILSLFYFFVRFTIKYSYQKQVILFFIAIFGFLLSLLTIFSFLFFQFNITYEGFKDITEFRNLYMPLGYYSNEWVTVLLALLPFQIYALNYGKKQWLKFGFSLSVLLTIFSILVSFSRGAYVALLSFALISFMLLYILKIYKPQALLKYYLFFCILSVLFITPYYSNAISTISMFSTTSHQRSFEGRTNVWKNSIQLIKKYPITGIGANNFSLKYSAINKNEDNPFSGGRVANSFLQLLIEKGIIGVVAYSFLCVVFFTASFKKRNKNTYENVSFFLFVASVISIFIREMSFSSVFENNGLAFIFNDT